MILLMIADRGGMQQLMLQPAHPVNSVEVVQQPKAAPLLQGPAAEMHESVKRHDDGSEAPKPLCPQPSISLCGLKAWPSGILKEI